MNSGSSPWAGSTVRWRASAVRVTPLDDEGNPVGEPFTTFGHVSIEFEGLEDSLLACERGLANARTLLGA